MLTSVSKQSEVALDGQAQAQDNRLLNTGTVSEDPFRIHMLQTEDLSANMYNLKKKTSSNLSCHGKQR